MGSCVILVLARAITTYRILSLLDENQCPWQGLANPIRLIRHKYIYIYMYIIVDKIICTYMHAYIYIYIWLYITHLKNTQIIGNVETVPSTMQPYVWVCFQTHPYTVRISEVFHSLKDDLQMAFSPRLCEFTPGQYESKLPLFKLPYHDHHGWLILRHANDLWA